MMQKNEPLSPEKQAKAGEVLFFIAPHMHSTAQHSTAQHRSIYIYVLACLSACLLACWPACLPAPGVCRIKTRLKHATKAWTKIAFGTFVQCKAKPAMTIVKAFAVAALKQQICELI